MDEEKKAMSPEEEQDEIDHAKKILIETVAILKKDRITIDTQFIVIDRLVERVMKHEPDISASGLLEEIFDSIKDDIETSMKDKEEAEDE